MNLKKYFVLVIVVLTCCLVESGVGKSHRRLKRRNQDETKDASQDLSVLDSLKTSDTITDGQIIQDPLALTSANGTETTDQTTTKKGKKSHRQHRRNHKKRKQHLKKNRKNNKNRDHETEEHELAIAGVAGRNDDASQHTTVDSSNKRKRGHHHKSSKHHQRQQRRLHRKLQVQQARKLLNEKNNKDRDTSADP